MPESLLALESDQIASVCLPPSASSGSKDGKHEDDNDIHFEQADRVFRLSLPPKNQYLERSPAFDSGAGFHIKDERFVASGTIQ